MNHDKVPLTAEVMGTEEEFPSDCEQQLKYLVLALEYASTAAQNLYGLIVEPETLKVNCQDTSDDSTLD